MNDVLFDHSVSNPPYQMEMSDGSKHGAASVKNVFHLFQDAAFSVSGASCFIYPAMRWVQRGGKGMRGVGKEMMNNPHLMVLDITRDSKHVFPTVGIHDGLSIVLHTRETTTGEVVLNGQVVQKPGDSIMPTTLSLTPVVDKVRSWMEHNNVSPITSRSSSRSMYGIESDFVEKHPDLVVPIEDNNTPMREPVKVLTNNMSGTAGVPTWYWMERENIPKAKEKIQLWHYVIRSALFSNQSGYISGGMIIDDESVYGRCKMSIMTLDTEQEMRNFASYIQTPLMQRLFDESIGGGAAFIGSFVPDLVDYTMESRWVDFTEEKKPLSEQLYELFGLTEEDRELLKGGRL